MSLLGGYKKKTNYDGYESLQLVDSSGDFSSRERGGSSIPANLAARAGPVTSDDYSTMDSSGKSWNRRTIVSGRVAAWVCLMHEWPRYAVVTLATSPSWIKDSTLLSSI